MSHLEVEALTSWIRTGGASGYGFAVLCNADRHGTSWFQSTQSGSVWRSFVCEVSRSMRKSRVPSFACGMISKRRSEEVCRPQERLIRVSWFFLRSRLFTRLRVPDVVARYLQDARGTGTGNLPPPLAVKTFYGPLTARFGRE